MVVVTRNEGAELDPSALGRAFSCEAPGPVFLREALPATPRSRRFCQLCLDPQSRKHPRDQISQPQSPYCLPLQLDCSRPSLLLPVWLAGLAGKSLSFTLGHHFYLFRKNPHYLAWAIMLWGTTNCFSPPVKRPFGEVWHSRMADNMVPLSFLNNGCPPELTLQHCLDAAAAN